MTVTNEDEIARAREVQELARGVVHDPGFSALARQEARNVLVQVHTILTPKATS